MIKLGLKMKNPFTHHPHSLDETYFEHMKFALIFGGKMVIGGLACMAHAILPFLFEKTGSSFMLKMAHDFITRMPTVEDRVAKLAEVIERKKQDCECNL